MPDLNRAASAQAAFEAYRRAAGDTIEPAILLRELITGLAGVAAGLGVNYGAVIAHAQASWLAATVNAAPAPRPTSESTLREVRSRF